MTGGATLTIDLGAVVANWRLLAGRVAPAECAAVVKADAYGLGAARVAPALAAAGCRTFFVAQPGEALALRALLPESTICCLGGLPPGAADAFAHARVRPVLNHLGEIEAWAARGRAAGVRLDAAVHIDTGMNRLGLGPDELETLAREPHRLDGIAVTHWISHLACAEADVAMNARQLGRFRMALARLPAAPASFANSSGVFLGRAFHFDLARPGVALYGANPTPGLPNPMAGVVRLDATVLQVRNVDSPMTVGYGATHRVERKGKLATVSVGYADGYLRSASGRGCVRASGAPAPVVGRVSMDLITVDVTDVPEGLVFPGATVEVMGPNRPVDAVAEDAGAIAYEILTSLGARYARVYLEPPCAEAALQ